MFRLSDKAYSVIKWCVIIFLPACAVLYTALSEIWLLPCPKEVSATISAICVFLGTVLCISSAEYNADDRQRELEEKIKELKAERKAKVIEEPKEEPIEEPEEPTEEPVEEPEEPIDEPQEEPTPEPIEEPTEEPKEPSEVFCECSCVVGKEYELLDAMKVREAPSVNARQLRRDELTPDGQAHALPYELAVLQLGTHVTCCEVSNNWIKCPSGWICAKDPDTGTDYVKEVPAEPEAVTKIRSELAKYTDPWNQGYAGLCQAFVHNIYWACGYDVGAHCCAAHCRDTFAQGGDPSNGDLVFSGSGYWSGVHCDCGRDAGHVGIYMDGYVYGSQAQYAMPYGNWVAAFGYGGHSNCGCW